MRQPQRFSSAPLVLFLTCLLAGTAPSVGFAQPPLNPRTPRAMGMGNTRIAIGGDYSAMFYNPAGLATIEEMEIQAVGVLWETNKDSVGALTDAFDLTFSLANPAPLLNFLQEHQGEPIFIRANSLSYVTLKKGPVGIGAALLVDYRIEQALFDDPNQLVIPGTDTLLTRRNTDLGGVASLSYDAIEKWLALGATLKVFNRWNAFSEASPNTLTASSTLDGEILNPFGGCGLNPGCVARSELGAGLDMGLLLMFPFDEIPALGDVPLLAGGRFQVGAVWQDVGDTRFDSGDIPQSGDVGIAYVQDLKIGKLRVGLDVRDLNRTQVGVADKLSFGAEMEFDKFVTLRAGVNETGAAVGGALRLGLVRLEGGFIQEMPDPELPAETDNRYFLSLGLGWYN